MLYTQKHLKNVLNPDSSKEHFHGLNIEQIKKLPQLIEAPVMIYDSLSRNDSLVVVTSELDSNSLPIIASIKPNGKGRYELETIETNFITSVHGRDNFINQVTNVLEQDKMLFCDKQKSQEMFERWGLQLSELTNTLDFNIIIHKINNIVNSKTTQNSDISIENQSVEHNSISSVTPDDNGIIGNTAYRYVPKKTYRKFDKETGLKIAKALDDEKIKFSGKISDDMITLTIDGNSIEKAEGIFSTVNKNISEYVLANMPDDTVSITEMNDYGYKGYDMLPISEETALRYLDNDDCSVYLLYEDSTEGQALTIDNIVNHKGMYGIETAEWESYITPLLAATKQVAEELGLPFSNRFSEGADEVANPFVYDGTMSLEDFRKVQEAESAEETSLLYHIYQVKPGEEYRNVRFVGLQALNSLGEKVDISNYNLVYSGSLKDIEGATLENKLDTIFYKFNQQRPTDFEGHSLSVSDVITVGNENEETAYYVDSFGFSDIPDFFKNKSIEDAKETPSSDTQEQEEPQNTIHFHKVGDFYEAYGNDALLAADSLDLTLTSKALNGERVPMVGIPQHTLRDYTKKLWESGFSTEVRIEPNGYLDNTANTDNTEEQEQPKEIIDTPSDKANTKNYAQIEQKTENYKITALDYGTDREKCRNNIEAIKTLKTIEDENRTATPEEQEILSKYVGWGGIADVFDESKSAWTKEYAELKELLTDSEYTSARASTLNAHYTSPIIISAMYKALSNLGFSSGKILEPSMGIGNFFGMLPEAMKSSKLYGVELDGISGRIAKQLYPKAHIQVKGFEKTDFTSNTFDVAIGNVPFGDIPIYDKEFKGSNLIHDYFFKKALDKVRQGGIVAFITSKGTLDKANSTVRRYLAERAELLGAIRLPNNAFKKNAGIEVTSDIIFLKKRNMPITLDDSNLPEWINLSKDSSGIEMNNYFVQHPDMVCGTMTEVSGRFGMETTCKPFDNADLSALIDTAISNINGSIGESYAEAEVSEDNSNINADIFPENYRNYCYTVIDNDIYYREGNNMVLQQFNKNKTTRIKGMIEISEALRELIKLQKENYPDEHIKAQQDKLNTLYDRFTASYGLLSNHNNKSIFRFDDTAALLLSLENIDENGNLLSKADIFTKRTIYPYQPITSVDTASEALTVSISERAGVDLAFMSGLCSKSEEEIIKDLEGVIFENPLTGKYETSDEYLSGNVREKLATARTYAEKDEKYIINVTALEQVQPEQLKPSEISVQLGSTWIPVEYFEQFMYELLNTPERCRSNFRWRSGNPFASSGDADNQTITVDYDENTATYGISNKSSYSADKGNVRASQTYGTGRMNAYTIIENTLNQKPVKIFDYIEDEKGTKRAVLNDKETLLAQDKQNSIKQAFQDWIFADAERTEDLCRIYNEKFNSLRPREYDGSHITFGGINPEISLLKHQKDAIAHTLYGGNTLLAHTVGAGKTFEMVASAMESKRLGLCTKSLICVPKAIVGQTAREFLHLYPTANILVPDEKDFSKANRERFCSRIATGNYDAVIISHTQLEKIPLSAERQIDFVQGQIDEITNSLEQLKFKTYEKGFTVKQLEATKKALTAKLEKLNNNDKRDTTITFEDLGVDKLYVDEAHLFKNRFFTTKMGRNVSGINASSASQRAEDLAMKCRYLDEITGSKGVVFATGTPISNSMTELYTMQNYLQHDVMVSRGLSHFDAWASCFGETKLSLELAPEGKGYQMKTRFAKFFNLPELMNMFKEIADIKTADVLKLPVPEAVYHTVTAEPSEYQKDMVDGLAQRAKAIRDKRVSADVDNMLNVTNDGRKLALDQRLLNELLPDNSHSKVNLCVDKVFEIWQNTAAQKGTQMIFCDLSTPDKSKFNVYDDIKSKLIKKGIPEDEIAFIHSYNTDEQKQQLFSKVRKGNIRVLLGSTEKMGTGTNVQNKLIAAHHLDCPWRPSDLEQRNGRIIRQGNTNPQVDIYNYVTKGTFDAYLYQLVENKQKFISQIMTSKSPARSAEDVDESVLSYAQIKALASGDPKIKEKMDLEIEVSRLRTVYAGYQEERRVMQTNITQEYPQRIQQLQERINGCKKDIEAASRTSQTDNFSPMTIYGQGTFTDKKEAGEALLAVRKPGLIGDYRGFKIFLGFNNLTKELNLILSLNTSHTIELGKDALGNITRIDNAINGIGKDLTITN